MCYLHVYGTVCGVVWYHYNLYGLILLHVLIISLLTFIEGSKGGAVVGGLAFHRCGLGLNPLIYAICRLNLLLVLSIAPGSFSPCTPVFSSPQKPTSANFNLTRNQVDEEPPCGCATSKSLFILFIY